MSAVKRYVLSQQADADIEEIFDHTRKEFGLDQAVKYLLEFEELFSMLVKHPNLGRDRPEIKAGLKSIAKSSHVVFYRKMPDYIRIVRVLHGSRDIPRFTFE